MSEPALPPPGPPAPDPSLSRVARHLDRALRVAGGALAGVGGFIVAALVVVLAPLRVRDLGFAVSPTRVPIAVLIAVVGALALIWFARSATGVRGGPLLPAAGWFVMVVLALRTTNAGDRLVMPDDWVATVALFAGTMVLVGGLVVGLTSPRRAAPRGPARSAEAVPAGETSHADRLNHPPG